MSKGFYKDIVKCFPTIEHAFSYGSGVFNQPGLYLSHDSKAAKPMIDLVFAVRNPISWHKYVGVNVDDRLVFYAELNSYIIG